MFTRYWRDQSCYQVQGLLKTYFGQLQADHFFAAENDRVRDLAPLISLDVLKKSVESFLAVTTNEDLNTELLETLCDTDTLSYFLHFANEFPFWRY